MNITDLGTRSLRLEAGYRILVQAPEDHVRDLLAAVSSIDSLTYGHYDRVTFQSARGRQAFRPRPSAQGGAFEEALKVPCLELSFLLRKDPAKLQAILEALYQAHPYEEPVILIQETSSTRFRDEECAAANPNKYWNRPGLAWVPEVQRS